MIHSADSSQACVAIEMGKHRIGERTCMGCGRKVGKTELLRFVKDGEGHALFDLHQNKAGRGSYLCPNQACFSSAAKKRRKAVRSGRRTVRIDASVLAQQVGEELAREVESLQKTWRTEDLSSDGVRHQKDDLCAPRARAAQRVVRSYRTFFVGGGSEWPK